MIIFKLFLITSTATSTVNSYWKPDDCDRQVSRGDFVRYHYSGFFKNGKKFDDAFEHGETQNTFIGNGLLIPELESGLVGMCVNEKRMIQIPPGIVQVTDSMSHDESPVVFDVELVDLWNPTDPVVIEKLEILDIPCSEPVKYGDYVRFKFKSYLLNGKLIETDEDEHSGIVGNGEIIRGLESGLMGMCPGELRKLIVPPHFAFGDEGTGLVPRQSSIIFQIRLMDKHNEADKIKIEKLESGRNCSRKSETKDFIRIHGIGHTSDGSEFWHVYGNETEDGYIGIDFIDGLNQGLIGACPGELRKITIPPKYGYGADVPENSRVPSNSVLIFTIRIADFHNSADVPILTNQTESNGIKNNKKCEKIETGEIMEMDFRISNGYNGTIDKRTSELIEFSNGKLIYGVYMVLKDVCIKQNYTVIIPPHYAYGNDGLMDDDRMLISPNAVLYVELYINQTWPQMSRTSVASCPNPELISFLHCDSDLSGEIEFPEFAFCLEPCRVQGEPMTDKQTALKAAFTRLDTDLDGILSGEEFSLRFAPNRDEL